MALERAVSDRELFNDVALLDFEDPSVRARADARAGDDLPPAVRALWLIVAVLGITSLLVAATSIA